MLCGRIVAKLFLARRKGACKFSHRLWSAHKLLFNAATINRFAISVSQPIDQFRTRSVLFVITVTRCEWLLLDGGYKGAVLFERAGDQKEAFARETAQRWRVVGFHAHTETQHAGLSRGRLLR